MSEKPKQTQTYIIIFLLILLTALLVGGGVYLLQERKIENLSSKISPTSYLNTQSQINPTSQQQMISPTQIVQQPTQIPTISEISIEESLKQAFANKYSKSQDDVNLCIND